MNNEPARPVRALVRQPMSSFAKVVAPVGSFQGRGDGVEADLDLEVAVLEQPLHLAECPNEQPRALRASRDRR